MVITDMDYNNIASHYEEILGRDLYKNKEVNACPHCDSNKIIKYGNYKNGQRYKCNICGRTFCKRTHTPFYYSKKNPGIWLKYIELMLENNTLKGCSEKLEIDISTAFYWRHKILNILMKVREPNKLETYIEMAKVLMKESFKGSRNAPKEEREVLWTIIAADNEEKIVARPICKSRWDYKAFNKIIYSRIDKASYILGRGDRFLWSIERKHNKGKTPISDEDNILIHYFRGIKKSMIRYYGVATKYLTHYLYWITIFSVQNNFDAISLLYNIIDRFSYIRNKDIKDMYLEL